jgi:hypothetical protein
MVSSKAKNGFNCVSCGTHRAVDESAASKTRTPPRVARERGLGSSLTEEGLEARAPTVKHRGPPAVPHGTSGTNNP